MTNKEIGKYGEEIAKNFLIKKGYKILETNWHYSRVSEIDIIAIKNDAIHFVEVKTRSQTKFGMPEEAINYRKMASIVQGTRAYLSKTNKRFKKIQIDAIAILLKKEGEPEINFIENISL